MHDGRDNLKPVKSTEEARARGAKGGSSPKRRQTLEAQKIMRKMLLSAPVLNDSTKASLKKIGVDVDGDNDFTTNAAILCATVMQKAFSGDLNYVKMAFEMGGQKITAKDLNDAERIELEKRRLDLLERGDIAGSDERPVIVVNRIDAPQADADGDTI